MVVCSRHSKLLRIALVGANQWVSKIKDMNAVAVIKRSYKHAGFHFDCSNRGSTHLLGPSSRQLIKVVVCRRMWRCKWDRRPKFNNYFESIFRWWGWMATTYYNSSFVSRYYWRSVNCYLSILLHAIFFYLPYFALSIE